MYLLLSYAQVALNYYSQWLVDNCGIYPDYVWKRVWTNNGGYIFRNYHNTSMTTQKVLSTLKLTCANVLFRPEFFQDRDCRNLGVKIRSVRPVVQFPQEVVELKFNIGTRTNGVDEAFWPQDLLNEVVTPEVLRRND